MMCSVERPPHSFKGDFGGITICKPQHFIGSFFFFFFHSLCFEGLCVLDGDSGRFSVRNDKMNHVGQTEADYAARSDSIILD